MAYTHLHFSNVISYVAYPARGGGIPHRLQHVVVFIDHLAHTVPISRISLFTGNLNNKKLSRNL